MKSFFRPALALTLLAAFAGVSPVQSKDQESREAPQARRAVQAQAVDRAEEVELTRFVECVSAALKKAEQKRQDLARQGQDVQAEKGPFSLWHGKRKTRKECPYPN